MYNNTLRKVTSLTLLTILLSSSAVFGLPGAVPAAHAQVASHPNLFVSAENSQYNNYFAGPQVIQVIVSDPNINRLDQAYGEPVVTVNGQRLRMVQTTDGNWYGYFADSKQAQIADSTAPVAGKGLNFGQFCSPTTAGTISNLNFGLTKGVAFPDTGITGAVEGTQSPSATVTATCSGAPSATVDEHVIRQNKTLTPAAGTVTLGQVNLASKNLWPFIQLFDFSAIPTPVTVDYQAAGGDQVVNLTFDRIPSNLISVTPDRTSYPENSNVFLTMNDPQLNIDPTEEDSWTWGTNASNSTLYYEAFNRNGVPDAEDNSAAMQNLIGDLSSFMFNHNGKFTFNDAAQGVRVVDFQSNGKQTLNGSSTSRGNPATMTTNHTSAGAQPVTFIETGGVNTGVFSNADGSKKTNIVTLTPAEEGANSIRGQSATFRYNDISGSIVGGFAFGSITMTATNNTWASGQRIPVTLTDMDANKNSKITEHLNFYDKNVDRIPAMKIGHPFTLAGLSPENSVLFVTQPTFGTGNVLSFSGVKNATDPNVAVDESFSGRPVFTWQNATGTSTEAISIKNGGGFLVDTNTPASSLLQSIHNTNSSGTTSSRFHGFNFLNYDFRSFTSLNGATGVDPTAVNVYLVYTTSASIITNPTTGAVPAGAVAIPLVNGSSLQNFVNLNGTTNSGVTAAISGTNFDKKVFSIPPTADIGFMFLFNNTGTTILPGTGTASTGGEQSIATPVATDFFSIGFIGDGTDNSQRINNAIYRFELEETGDNTGVFTGTNQFVMLNQLNILDPSTYSTLRPISHDVFFAAIQDMLQSEARAPQVTYLDLGADGVNSQISAQQDIPTHSGTVSFDQKTYKVGDTVTITVNDQDLNTNNDLIVIYTAVKPTTPLTTAQDPSVDTIGKTGLGTYSDGRAIGRLLDVQFGQTDIRWTNANIAGVNANTASCFTEGIAGTPQGFATSLSASGFSLVETAAGSGVFSGTFEVPDKVCQSGAAVGTNGLNMKVNYVDFRDESGKLVEVSDNAGIRGNTGSIKLDKAVYPVPFGTVGSTAGTANFDPAPGGTPVGASLNGVFPLHRDLSGNGIVVPASAATTSMPAGTIAALPAGTVIVHARVNDPDYTLAPTGTNFISVTATGATGGFGTDGKHGVVAFQLSRQGSSVILATAGGSAKVAGRILDLGTTTQLPAHGSALWNAVPDLGPIGEISPGSGIFQADLPIELTDGPAGTDCPAVNNWDALNGTTGFKSSPAFRFAKSDGTPDGTTTTHCVRQGDVLTVTYYDTADASGNPQTVTDSATFDLRNGVLQSDKSVYIIGSDMILTLVEPDFNLDSQTAETLPLDLVEWDSHAFKGTMGPLGGQSSAFDAKPSTFVETGKDTGIFQAVIKIPKQLGTTLLERGEQINLEYTDWGPAGSKTVGANNQDIELTVYTSNFGATVQLDQKVYTWTDRVYMTVVAPDHNFDPNLIDTIGQTAEDKVIVSTRGHQIYYTLSETGVDTGIFTGYVILTGDSTIKDTGGVDGEGTQPSGTIGTGQTGSCSQSSPCGPTDGFLPSEDSDGVSVSFEFTRDQTVTGSALIRWNIGEISWLQPSYPANGQGVLQIVDPDMNLNPKAVDKFDTNVWSDSDSGGIKLTMTETGQDTGIFQGTVYFTTNFQSSGNRLHVSEGDTVTGEYKDRTLPPPYTPADQLRLTATTFIGTIVPPLERAPASNPRIVDSFGNAINGTVKVGQQIQVTADLANGQNRDQPFAYLVQIQDSNGVTVSLSWITGTLSAGQSLNPAQSWTPSSAGTYTAQIFVWQSIDNPNALSPPLSTTINVQ